MPTPDVESANIDKACKDYAKQYAHDYYINRKARRDAERRESYRRGRENETPEERKADKTRRRILTP